MMNHSLLRPAHSSASLVATLAGLFLLLSPPAVSFAAATGSARDFVAELCEPDEHIRHWLDVRLRTEDSPDARFRVILFTSRESTCPWYDLKTLNIECTGFTVLDDKGIPVSDPQRVVQVLERAIVICRIRGEVGTSGLSSQIGEDIRETVREDLRNIGRQIITGIAKLDFVHEFLDTIFHIFDGPARIGERRRERAVDAFRKALVYAIPKVIGGASETRGGDDAMTRALGEIVRGVASPDVAKEGISQIESLRNAMDYQSSLPGTGSSMRDWIKPPPVGRDLPCRKFWYDVRGVEVGAPLSDTVVRAGRPVAKSLPPLSRTGASLGDVLKRPAIRIESPKTGRLLPASTLDSTYLRRVQRWQAQDKLIKGLSVAKKGLKVLEVLSTAASVVRAYQRTESLNWHNPELESLAAAMAGIGGRNSREAIMADGLRGAMQDYRTAIEKLVAAVAEEVIAPKAWGLTEDAALEYIFHQLPRKYVPNPAAAVLAVSIGFEASVEAFKVMEIDETLHVCSALASIEQACCGYYNARLPDAKAWSPDNPPDPETVSNMLWCRRLATGSAGCFYLRLANIMCDPNNLSDAKAMIDIEWEGFLPKAVPNDDYFALKDFYHSAAQQLLASANLAFPSDTTNLSTAVPQKWLPLYRTFTPGTGPALDGTWRGKAYATRNRAGDPTRYADVIAYLYSRPDGSFEGRFYLWADPTWPSDKQPPPDPSDEDWNEFVNVRGRSVWDGKTYFTVVVPNEAQFWADERGWKGELSADGMQLKGKTTSGFAFNLKRLESKDEPEPPVEPPPVEGQGMLDVVFCIDTTGSMADDIHAVQEASKDIIEQLSKHCVDNDISLQVGLVTYQDHTDAKNFAGRPEEKWLRKWPLTTNSLAMRDNILDIEIHNMATGGDIPEDLYAALMCAMDKRVDWAGKDIKMGWRNGAAKIILVMTDAPPHDPDFEDRTLPPVAVRAAELDPVHIYPMILPGSGPAFLDPTVGAMTRVAEATGGEITRVGTASELPEALVTTVKIAIQRHREEVWREENPPVGLFMVVIAIGGLAVLAVVGVIARQVWGQRPARAARPTEPTGKGQSDLTGQETTRKR